MEVLVRKAKKGDEEAFIKLIDNYMLQMYKVAKSRMSNEEAIGDAIQETIMSAFKNPRYCIPSPAAVDNISDRNPFITSAPHPSPL